MENPNSQNNPVGTIITPEMSNTTSEGYKRKLKRFTGLVAAFSLLLACAPVKEIPVNTSTETHVKDSTVLVYKDSIRVIERSRYKDYAGLLDTLKVNGNRSHSTTWIDTTLNVLNTELVEDPIEEKTRIIYKDRLVLKDTVITKEIPIPVEIIKEKKIYPRWLVLLSILGIILTGVEGFRLYIRLKKKLPLG